MVEEAIDAVCL